MSTTKLHSKGKTLAKSSKLISQNTLSTFRNSLYLRLYCTRSNSGRKMNRLNTNSKADKSTKVRV